MVVLSSSLTGPAVSSFDSRSTRKHTSPRIPALALSHLISPRDVGLLLKVPRLVSLEAFEFAPTLCLEPRPVVVILQRPPLPLFCGLVVTSLCIRTGEQVKRSG